MVTDRNRSDFGTCGFELVKAYLYGKNSDEYSVAFRSFAKEGGHPKRYEEMVGLCRFLRICYNRNNNQQQYTANVHTAYVANEGINERFANRKRVKEAVLDEAHFL